MNTRAIFFVTFLIASVLGYSGTPLDDYVHAPDPAYQWNLARTQYDPTNKYTLYTLLMTSQTWMTSNYSDHLYWRHQVFICVPDVVRYTDYASLAIGKGNDASLAGIGPSDVLPITQELCKNGVLAAALGQIPNQPIVFKGDGRQRSEDAAIAPTYKYYMQEGNTNPTQLLLFAMTKAAVRAMDTIQTFLSTTTAYNPQKFIVAGASKRGWTTWLASAVDERIVATIPVVINFLNARNNIVYSYNSYGAFTYALDDYIENNFFDYLDLPEWEILMQNIDPLSYNDRYVNIKKLLITASQDQFFLLDGTRPFWSALKGPKWLSILPGADHSLAAQSTLLLQTIVIFHHAVAQNIALPSYTWDVTLSSSADVAPTITINTAPGTNVAAAKLWTSVSKPGFRDFRQQSCRNESNPACFTGRVFTSTNLPASNSFTIPTVAIPTIAATKAEQVWTGSFVQLTFALPLFGGAQVVPFVLTSEANVYPNYYPFPDYVPNYAAVGEDPTCFSSLQVTQSQQGSWVANDKTITQYSVSIRTTKAIWSLPVQIDAGFANSLYGKWGVTAKPLGYIHTVDDWRLNQGLSVPAGVTLQFGYQIYGNAPATLRFPGILCAPPPRDCSVTAVQVSTNTWNDNDYHYRQYAVTFTNKGAFPTAFVNIKLDLSAGNWSPSQAWNLATSQTPADIAASQSVTYRAPVWNLNPGSSSNGSGYIVRTPIANQGQPGYDSDPALTVLSTECVN